MSKFKVGDKVRRVSPTDDHHYWNNPYNNMYHGNIYTVRSCISDDISFEEADGHYLSVFFELVESKQPEDKPVVYSPQELSYIEELEEKVDQLEDICCEYAKTVAEKDEQIATYKQHQDWNQPLFNKVDKLVHLVSKDYRVARLLGATAGDCVLDVIYNYLVIKGETN